MGTCRCDNTLRGSGTAEGTRHSRSPSHPTLPSEGLSLHNDLEFPKTNRTHHTNWSGWQGTAQSPQLSVGRMGWRLCYADTGAHNLRREGMKPEKKSTRVG